MERKEEKKCLLIQSIENKGKGTFALDKMYEYQQYHGIRRETPYVLRGSVIGCQYGTRLSKLDMKMDYGVYSGDLPVMTCADYKPENIYGFGSCLCPEKKYAGCVPMNPEVHPNGEKAVKLPENEYAHICIPRIKSGWKQAEGRTMIYTGEEGYVPALTDEAILVCQYGGMINVRSAAKDTAKVKMMKKAAKSQKDLVTKEMMKKFKWKKVSNNEIKKINKMLRKYNITQMESIRLFMATCGHESGKGNITLEKLKKDGTVVGDGYGPNDRGAGYIQVTERSLQLKFLKTVGDNFRGSKTAEHIAKKYPWEAAGWFWSTKEAKETAKGSINDYINFHGGSEVVFLITQYWVNSWPKGLSQENAVAIREGVKKWEIKNNKLYIDDIKTCRLPVGWEDRKKNYVAAKKIFR